MNERIRLLAEQAGSTHKQNLGVYQFYTDELEKFAELLVKECIDILPEKVKIDDLYDGKILVQCGTAIKEHFGV